MRADSLTLTLLPVLGTPGGTVTVEGVIANPGTSTLFLNNENFTLGSSNFLNGDVTDFFLNAPISLDGGTDSGTIALFTFDIGAGTPGGTYTGNFLDILGGPGPNDQNELVSTEFSVTVTPAVTTPEAGSSLQLSAMGLMLIVGWALSRKKPRLAL